MKQVFLDTRLGALLRSCFEQVNNKCHIYTSVNFSICKSKQQIKLMSARYILLISLMMILTNFLAKTQATNDDQVNKKACPYPSVNVNCHVNIVSHAPSVSFLNSEFLANEYATLKQDTQASYKCDQGYELLGQQTITCLSSGRWSSPAPHCVINIAFGKPTNQSSTVKGGESSNANDAKLITQHDQKYCTETKLEQSPWWQIDLLQAYDVRSVRILGRACCNSAFSLHDLEIRVGNSSALQGNRLCAWHPGNVDDGIAKDYHCATPIVGRFVSIQMVGIESALSLCEVMIFSTSEFPSSRCSVKATIEPSTKPQAPSTASSTTVATSKLNDQNSAHQQLVVFNGTCFEFQAASGGSYLAADTYCKARKGALLHSVTDLTHGFVASELERLKPRLKSKLVWLGARRESGSLQLAGGGIGSGSSAGTIGGDVALLPPTEGILIDLHQTPNKASRSLIASLDASTNSMHSASSLMRRIGGLEDGSEAIFSNSSPLDTTSFLYQASSGAGGTFSRGSQTFGLPTTVNNSNVTPKNLVDHPPQHPQRSLIVSQPSQVASSFFTPRSTTTQQQSHLPQQLSSSPTAPSSSQQTAQVSTLSGTFHSHRLLKQQPQSFSFPSTLSTQASPSSQSTSVAQTLAPTNIGSTWHWSGDLLAGDSSIMSFMWADDQPNNYNSQQDCIAMDGTKKWLWNDVTCELDYLPWICQYRATSCGTPDRHENSTILEQISFASEDATFNFGKTVTYACPLGHKLDGPKQRKCRHDGTWTERAPRCQYVDCGLFSEGSLENGKLIYLNESKTTFGSQVKFVCSEDYVLVSPGGDSISSSGSSSLNNNIGQDIRQCDGDGKWSGKQPYCAYKWCPKLQQISNAQLNVSGFSEGSLATYTCNPGHKLIGNDTRRCLLGGKWTNQEPFCQFVECGEPKRILNGKFDLVNGTTNYLSIAQYSCYDNYTLSVPANNKLVCQHTNRWLGREPECSLIDCQRPIVNSASSIRGSSYSIHSVVEYKCDVGFKDIAGNIQRVCGADGRWTGQPLTCKYVDCGRVAGILKGDITYVNGTTHMSSIVQYDCTPGNRLVGAKQRTCNSDGRWTGQSPRCEEIRCEPPDLPANGSAIYIGNDRSFKEQSFSVGVTVQYECDRGHMVLGSWATRLCQASGEWSGEAPVCKFVECNKPPSIENGRYVLKFTNPTAPPGATGERLHRLSVSHKQQTLQDLAELTTATSYGSVAHYSCDTGYRMQGNGQRECLPDGSWRLPLPICEPIQCAKPDFYDDLTHVTYIQRQDLPNADTLQATTTTMSTSNALQSALSLAKTSGAIRLIANGQWLASWSMFSVGDKLVYSCTPGFELYGGPEVRTCSQYGQWSGSSTPRCKQIDCGKPAPIGQEGRYYLLNDSTIFNSMVEYSCVQPFKLVEMKIRQQSSSSLIETLSIAQLGVSTILTALPVGVKVCANNGKWMPNDQQPKCVSATDALRGVGFDGSDNSLDLSGVGGRPPTSSNSGDAPNIDLISGAPSNPAHNHHHHHTPTTSTAHHDDDSSATSITGNDGSASIFGKVMMAICLLVMLTIVMLTLICIRSSKSSARPKHVGPSAAAAQLHHAHAHAVAHMAQVSHPHAHAHQVGGGGTQSFPAAAAAALQLQLAAASAQGSMAKAMNMNMNMAVMAAPPPPPPPLPPQQHALSANGSLQQADSEALGLAAAGGGQLHALGGNGSDSTIFASSISNSQQNNKQHIAAYREPNALMANGTATNYAKAVATKPGLTVLSSELSHGASEAYLRLSVDSDSSSGASSQRNGQHQAMLLQHLHLLNQNNGTKTIRHNPKGLVTFVSPAQRQPALGVHRAATAAGSANSNSSYQTSPQSSASSAASPSSCVGGNSALNTRAARLNATDTSSGNSSSGSCTSSSYSAPNGANAPLRLASPPSLPLNPPPAFRVQQQPQTSLNVARYSKQQESSHDSKQQQQQHYMEPDG